MIKLPKNYEGQIDEFLAQYCIPKHCENMYYRLQAFIILKGYMREEGEELLKKEFSEIEYKKFRRQLERINSKANRIMAYFQALDKKTIEKENVNSEMFQEYVDALTGLSIEEQFVFERAFQALLKETEYIEKPIKNSSLIRAMQTAKPDKMPSKISEGESYSEFEEKEEEDN